MISLSEYELTRLENIRKQNEMLKGLGLAIIKPATCSNAGASTVAKQPPAKRKRKSEADKNSTESTRIQPTRFSLRNRGGKPEELSALQEQIVKAEDLVVNVRKRFSGDVPIFTKKENGEDALPLEDEEGNAKNEALSKFKHAAVLGRNLTGDDIDEKQYKDDGNNEYLNLTSPLQAKVTKEMIFSIAIHPSRVKYTNSRTNF